MKVGLTAAIMLVACLPAGAHRLDEYLQAVIFSIEKNQVQAELTLTPGVAVLPGLLAEMRSDPAGVISEANRHAYVWRVLRDLSLIVDSHPLALQLDTQRFPSMEEMQNGFGEIRIQFHADLPPGVRHRKLVFENRHQNRISAYQVNCLVPRDSAIRIMAQNRNFTQSHYELEYVQDGTSPWVSAASNPLAIAAYLAFAWFVLLWTQRGGKTAGMRSAAR